MYIADLHIHSKYSRATSRNCDLPNLDLWAKRKGVGLLGTGDFTHPAWREEIRDCLEPAEEGLYRLKDEKRLPDFFGSAFSPRFVLSGEISCIYKKNDRVRKVHNVILLPDIEAAERLSRKLETIGNVHSDGRPILGLSSRDLLEITLDVCPEAIFIPAHIWTPHFSLFGAFSGFDTIEECFGDLTGHIRALETGLSSDPPMNRRVPQLDGFTLVSNSDAHSPAKLAREANIIDAPLSYPALKRALETGEGFSGTVEFFPEEGKYHLDGHRNCNLRISPAETRSYGGKCPVCGKKITIGVLNRVEQFALRPEGYEPEGAKPFSHLMPLPEVVAQALGAGETSNRTVALYEKLLAALGPELDILRAAPTEEIARVAGEAVAEGIRRLRAGKVNRLGGFDGEYGTISLFRPGEQASLGGQISFLTPSAVKESVSAAKNPSDAQRNPSREMEAAADDSPASDAQTKDSAPLQSGQARRENDEQRAAVESSAPVVAVVAGPGTGKTSTLVARAAYLVEELGVPPQQITAVTFTNQAAAELRERLGARLSDKKAASRMTIGTFHSICLALLTRQSGEETPILIDQTEALSVAAEVLTSRGSSLSPARFLRSVSARKNGLVVSIDEEAYADYCGRLSSFGALDFDDLLIKALDLTPDARFTHLLVDEFQDINDLQYRLVKLWHGAGRSLFVIGDPDQSIYGFRGASAACFDRLKSDFPEAEEIRLLRNYRSSPQILSAALSVVSHNPGGKRALFPACKEGAAVRLVRAESDFTEAVFIAKEIARMTGGLDMLEAHAVRGERETVRSFSDIAVLCRTHRHAHLIESCLRKESIPCLVSGREAYLGDPEVRGITSFFRFLVSPADKISLRACLTLLWRCPPELTSRAELEAAKGKSAADTAAALRLYPTLAPWIALTEEFAPRIDKDRPQALIEQLADRLKLSSPAIRQLADAAALSPSMSAFLQLLLLGEEPDIRRSTKKAASGAVRLMTLHGAKGLEFPVVFVCGVSKGQLPLESARIPSDPEEERRLFFVGLTRAKEELIILSPAEPSPFLSELPGTVQRETSGPKKRAQSKQISMF